MVLAALLFMKEISELTKVSDISDHPKLIPDALPEGWAVYKIQGALFFAAADRIFSELAALSNQHKGIVLYTDSVSLLDAGGLAALNKFIDASAKNETKIVIADLQFRSEEHTSELKS